MTLTTGRRDGALYLTLRGELDHHASRGLIREAEEAVDTAAPLRCVLDLTDLTFMDSSGIAVILRLHRRMSALGGRLAVEGARAQPLRVLEASGLERLVEITAKRG